MIGEAVVLADAAAIGITPMTATPSAATAPTVRGLAAPMSRSRRPGRIRSRQDAAPARAAAGSAGTAPAGPAGAALASARAGCGTGTPAPSLASATAGARDGAVAGEGARVSARKPAATISAVGIMLFGSVPRPPKTPMSWIRTQSAGTAPAAAPARAAAASAGR